MKTPTSLLTHAAVFAVGVMLALVASHNGRNRADEAAGGGGGGRNGSSQLGGSSSADSGKPSPSSSSRARDERERRSGRSGEANLQRLTSIVHLGDPLERQAALMDLLKRLGPGEFAAVAEQYQNMDHFGDGQGEFSLILRSWTKADPLAALEYAGKSPSSAKDTAVVLSAWAVNDGAAAVSWALEHHEGDGPNPYLASVIRGIATYDTVEAGRLVATMPSSHERGNAIDSITNALFVKGVDAATAFPSTIQDPKLQASFVDAIATRLASKDASQAAIWLASFPDAALQNHAARRVGEALAGQDPTAAAKWLRTLQPEAQAEGARGMIPIMSNNDIPGTATWVATLSGMPNYNKVVEEFVWSCDTKSPEQSAAWIAGISDPKRQTQVYYKMLGAWAKRDAPAVQNWVANNQVPESVSNHFNPPPKPPKQPKQSKKNK